MYNLLIVLALLCSLHLCGATVYYVKPTQPCNATCPSDHLCLTLDDYTVNSERYFTSNAVFLFLSGHHKINSSFNVSAIHNLVLEPYTEGVSVVVNPLIHDPYVSVLIQFEMVSHIRIAELTLNSVSFAFENSSDIALNGLLVSVDPNVPYHPSNPAVVSSTKSSMSLSGCKFLKLQDTGILSMSSKIVLLNQSFFYLNATALSFLGNSIIVLQGNTTFWGNYPQKNGIIRLHDHYVFASERNNISSSSGAISGSGHSTLILNGTVEFTHNFIDASGGAIALKESSTAVIMGVVSFNYNHAFEGGGAITLSDNCYLVLNGTVMFTGNHGVKVGGAIFLSGSSTILLNGDITFINNIVRGQGGAIASVEDSSVILQGHVTFIGNSATRNGGAMALMGNRTICLPEPNNTLITLVSNTAHFYGGAFYFALFDYFKLLQCAFFFEYLPIDSVFNFTDNSAGQGGDAIYGAYFEYPCAVPSGLYLLHRFSNIINISHFSPSFSDDPSLISSDPLQLCFCKHGRPNCMLHYGSVPYSVYPGELFHVHAVVVGDMQGLVNSTVLASIETIPAGKYAAELGDLQSIQRFCSRNCMKFTYSISVNITEFSLDLLLSVSFWHNASIIKVVVLACPVGFALSSEKLCNCARPLLDIGTVSCNISEKSIQRQGTVWIGALQHSTNQTSVVYSITCPFSYCRRSKANIPVHQNDLDQDVQCNYHRSGILCGGCRANYSLALGSNRCLPGCTNIRFSLIIAFAAAGIALVFFIKILNLTVSQGTLNGLIFYANVIGVQDTLALPTGGSSASRAVSTFFYAFIALLNLDLGIETCFYNNMNSYSKTWLQFTFPTYILIIALFIIIISKYSTRGSRLFGNNSVPVLATLIMLSYAKLLRAVISPLSVSSVEFLNGTTISVWEFDGNLQYLTGKHIPLFVFALSVLGLLMLFTFVIISIQWLNRGTHYQVLCWVTKLKPFFDAFTGPLKDKHHYWIGILLLVRCVIFLIVFISTSHGNGTTLVCIVFAALIILTLGGSKYKNTNLSILEQSYILNFGLFAAGTVYIQYVSFSGNQEALFIASAGTAFLQFVATVIFHACVRFRKPLNQIKLLAMRMRNILKIDSESQYETSEEREPIVQLRHNSNIVFRESMLAYVDED